MWRELAWAAIEAEAQAAAIKRGLRPDDDDQPSGKTPWH